MKSLAQSLRSFREARGFNQEYVADKLGMSRPTYVFVEKGEREITLSEAKTLADLYEVELDALLSGKESAKTQVTLKTTASQKSRGFSLRVSVPRRRSEKFKEVLLYVLERIGCRPNVGEVVLYKILYFIDFDYYEKYEDQLIGATYIKNKFGPTPVEFKKIVDRMIENGEIETVKSKVFKYEQRKYLPLREPNLNVLTAREIQMIDDVIAKHGHRYGKELSEITHRDVPWITAEELKPIDYEAVFYRTPEFSVRSYESPESAGADDDSL